MYCLNQVLRINPHNGVAWNNKGELLAQAGQEYYHDALDCFKKAVELHPDYERAKDNYQKILKLLQNQ
ncbi:MAG: tetratricopeptide repeat protein [Prevotellaceae bacterium]|jgi:tetratricopeptide (TPR) repeat protein|nr:tetratricopeptide repeat protein [Prevotellaceae bacterium]